MDGWMDGWMDRWMDGWVDGWVDGQKERQAFRLIESNRCFITEHAETRQTEKDTGG